MTVEARSDEHRRGQCRSKEGGVGELAVRRNSAARLVGCGVKLGHGFDSDGCCFEGFFSIFVSVGVEREGRSTWWKLVGSSLRCVAGQNRSISRRGDSAGMMGERTGPVDCRPRGGGVAILAVAWDV